MTPCPHRIGSFPKADQARGCNPGEEASGQGDLDLSIDSLLHESPRRAHPLSLDSVGHADLSADVMVDMTAQSPPRLPPSTRAGASPLVSEAPDDHVQLVDQLAATAANSDKAAARRERDARRVPLQTAAPARHTRQRCAAPRTLIIAAHESLGFIGKYYHLFAKTPKMACKCQHS